MNNRHDKLILYRAEAEKWWDTKNYKDLCLASEEKTFVAQVRNYYLQGFMDAMEHRDENKIFQPDKERVTDV